MKSRLMLAQGCGVLTLFGSSAFAGSSEIEIRESDIVFSRTQPLEVVVRMDATKLVRRWAVAGGELYVRIQAVEPIETERPNESIRLAAVNGVVGRIVLDPIEHLLQQNHFPRLRASVRVQSIEIHTG